MMINSLSIVTPESIERAKCAARRERAEVNAILIPRGFYVDADGHAQVIPDVALFTMIQ